MEFLPAFGANGPHYLHVAVDMKNSNEFRVCKHEPNSMIEPEIHVLKRIAFWRDEQHYVSAAAAAMVESKPAHKHILFNITSKLSNFSIIRAIPPSR